MPAEADIYFSGTRCMIQIKPDRLLADLRELAGFGKAGTGVNRLALSTEDIEARRWLAKRMSEAGLLPHLDAVGNVYGRFPGVERAILVGSHTDTVPMGGWLDGALGVIYGLEIARAAIESDKSLPIGVDVISFEDEEGTYLPCLGSRSFCGELKGDEIKTAQANGVALSDALAVLQDAESPLRCDRTRTLCYFEAHIEQGPRLESHGVRIGAVTGLVGIRRFRIRAHGRADHAGTTPMPMRKDAGMALFRFATWIHDEFARIGSADTVWNIGRMTLRPGAANVVPSEAELILEFRDTDTAVLDRLEQNMRARLGSATGVSLQAELTARIEPALMAAPLVDTIAAATRELGEKPLLLPSGAGHDAMIVSRIVPSAMLFVPSIGGRSHDVSENTADADIVFGCEVLARAVSNLQVQLATGS
jgi:N-carbamoyl-L-amino-acid hydrolase